MKQARLAVLGIAWVLSTSLQAQSFTKSETIEYHDNTTSWVLGQIKRTTINGIETATTTYHPVTALPIATKQFGKLQQTLTYDAASTVLSGQRGTLKTVADGNGHVTTLTNWKRGIPQLIQLPGTPDQPVGASKSAVVNNSGQIALVTDENGYKTCYEYDAMGRVQLITYPSETQAGVCDSSAWNPTIRVFAASNTAKYGLPAGHWQQIVATGNGVQTTYYDGLWRPVVVERFDNANPSTTRSISVTRYDADGQPVFQSYPMASLADLAAVSHGTRTFYDALDRVTRIEQDSELGVLATTKVYGGMRITATNPRQQQTIVDHRMYDQPTYDLPHGIIHPEGASTEIYLNALDKPYALRRRNVDGSMSVFRYYHYDAYQQLCRVTEPETGATVMGYDGAGNLAWSSSGLAASTPCDGTNSAVVARKAARTYDARNHIRTLTFPDGVGNQSWSYTPDGLPASATTNNSNGGTQANNTYSYNKRRLMVGESLIQPGWYTWSIGYGYNANGHLASHAYPDASSVSYLPNALGQPTQAGSYATGVSYHPNGAIRKFTYGNGIVHEMVQNARQLPSWVKGGLATHFSYGYDANSNITQITDHTHAQNGRQTRSMTYDGLDRLKTVTSPMYGAAGASYNYDVLDNLTRVTTGGTAARDHHYCYDANWRLTNVKTGSCGGASVIGLGYDVQGNLDNKNGQNFDFDYGNRLRVVTGQEHYRYDGHGRRVLAWSPTLGNLLSQYGQDGVLRYQHDGRKSKAYNYIYLGGSLVATRETPLAGGVSTLKYQHTDALSSPVAVTDAGRVVLERTEYEPYGKVINGTPKDGPGYTGHVLDAATGLNYMQQRYYDPGIGRFLSVDPVTADGNTGGNFNRYWYANNNPYRFTDPDGRMPMGQGGSHATEDRMEYLRRMEEAKREQEKRAKDDARRQRIASIRTYMRSGKTVFTRGGLTRQWPSRNAVSRRSLPGAEGPYSSKDVYPVEGPYKGESHANEYGPNDILKTDDVRRGRWLHGGGTGLADPLAPQQGWKPTLGCTRMQNEDIQELVDMVREFKTAYPEQKIPYERVNQ